MDSVGEGEAVVPIIPYSYPMVFRVVPLRVGKTHKLSPTEATVTKKNHRFDVD